MRLTFHKRTASSNSVAPSNAEITIEVSTGTGCCPINGSVSRTAMGEQYQGKTQLTGIVAGISKMILLLCGTGFIGFLPVPVLTAIVISALLGATEFELAVRLWKVSRSELLQNFQGKMPAIPDCR